ncbi:hypothetical protein MTO96_014116 [Rhipicephalus appendiculatus]
MRLVVEDLGGDFIQLLVDIAYHIPLHDLVRPHNVADVLDLAEKLELASNRGYAGLAREAFGYLVTNFDKVWRNSQFETLTPEEMRTILEDDRLHAPNEVEDVFNALVKWIHADEAARKGYLAKFLPLLRLAWCSVTDFEKVITNPDVQGDADCLKVLSVIHQSTTQKSMAVGKVAGTDLSHRMWLMPRIPKDIIVVFGGWNGHATNNMLTYNCRSQKWRDIGNESTLRRAGHGMAAVDQCIYVVGGSDGMDALGALDTVLCFDVARGRWSSKANMGRARCYVSDGVVWSQGYIYAMGGYNGIERSRTAERYCVEDDQWTNVADMNYIRSAASAATACGRIYM